MSDSRCPIVLFLHHTPTLGIPVEMVQFLFKLLLKHISCCAPRFPLILTAKVHSLCIKESEIWKGWSRESEILKSELRVQSEILVRSELESDILPLTPHPWGTLFSQETNFKPKYCQFCEDAIQFNILICKTFVKLAS